MDIFINFFSETTWLRIMKSLTILSFLWKCYNLWWLPPGVCELCSLLAIFHKPSRTHIFALCFCKILIYYSRIFVNGKQFKQICLGKRDKMLGKHQILSCFHNLFNKWAATWDFQQCGMCRQQRLRPACAYAQSDQSLCLSLDYFMIGKLLPQ